jgi:hypothetical protein
MMHEIILDVALAATAELLQGNRGYALGFAALNARLHRAVFVFLPQLGVQRVKNVFGVWKAVAKVVHKGRVVLAGVDGLNRVLWQRLHCFKEVSCKRTCNICSSCEMDEHRSDCSRVTVASSMPDDDSPLAFFNSWCSNGIPDSGRSCFSLAFLLLTASEKQVSKIKFAYTAGPNNTLTRARQRLEKLHEHAHNVGQRVRHTVDSKKVDEILSADAEFALGFRGRVSRGQRKYDCHEVEAVGTVFHIKHFRAVSHELEQNAAVALSQILLHQTRWKNRGMKAEADMGLLLKLFDCNYLFHHVTILMPSNLCKELRGARKVPAPTVMKRAHIAGLWRVQTSACTADRSGIPGLKHRAYWRGRI